MNGSFADFSATLPLKVCGLTRARDVRLCLELGVRFTGFIFARSSPRYLAPEAAAALPGADRRIGPASAAGRVGVFAGESPAEVLRIMKAAKLDYAQLHGGEDEKFCRRVGAGRVIKVLWPSAFESVDLLLAECERFARSCALFLFDAGRQSGGSGETLAWNALRGFKAPKPWILAGGLGPDNLAQAVETCLPWAVDCNSALEDAPGIKNAEKLKAAAAVLRAGQRNEKNF